MSLVALNVVRAINEPYAGQDLLPSVRAAIAAIGPEPPPDVLLAYWSQDNLLRHVDPDVEWDSPLPGVGTARGSADLLRWWGEWLEAWESCSVRIREYRDLGEWVLTVNEISATGRDGMLLEITNFQLWRVHEGKVSRVRIFFDEPSALAAAGQS